jgi:acetyl-CoA/propionyl-CoA carboxylase biotin carboxyl carrier protein
MFKKILIANRSEIAVRVINACRELEIEALAVYSEADKESLHVLLADQAYKLEGESHRVYLDGRQIIEIAKKARADAIHPGYGFLSENSEFAEDCLNAGLAFIGPKPDVIRRMGSKIESRRAMEAAGVKFVPGTVEPVTESGVVQTLAKLYGYPIAIKASAGGGGRGLKVVRQDSEVDAALAAAQREGASYFGSDEVYVEKYLDLPRHIEVQILADNHGNVVHLGERECSVQRRHQKLLEESPAFKLTTELREELLQAAARGARSIGYTNAGTFEGLVAGGKCYFLEVNTRVQVEHPVTEMVTGIDIVKEQISIAAGEKLSFKQEDVQFKGHAIECRINAENPYKNFLPNPGVISFYREPRKPWVRVDSACYEGGRVLPFYDSLLAKLVVWGRTRQEAIARTKAALRDFRIEGVATTIPFHLALLSNRDFVEGKIDTGYIERVMIKEFMKETPPTAQETQSLEGQRDVSISVSTSKSELVGDKRPYRNFEVRVNDKTINVSVREAAKESNTKKPPPGKRSQIELKQSQSEKATANGVQTVFAPMGGLVKKLNVGVNDTVTAGQVLLIFEAMKMETEIFAQIAGRIQSLNVKAGETVGANHPLLTLSKK